MISLIHFIVDSKSLSLVLIWMIQNDEGGKIYWKSKHFYCKVHSKKNSFMLWHSYRRTLKTAVWRFHCNMQDFLLSLKFFNDKTWFHFYGVLVTSPAMFTISGFNQSCFHVPYFWHYLGIVQNWNCQKGKSMISRAQ